MSDFRIKSQSGLIGGVVIWDCAHTETLADDVFRDLFKDKIRDDVGDVFKASRAVNVRREICGIFEHCDVDDCEVDFFGDICVTGNNNNRWWLIGK